ncbi:MAG: hypothetical protein MUP28_11045 [Candidatus Aminicenantes bacterium]|nr:hypothetical protein [Candidatus Aminicenantes bacterium]
MRKPFFFLIISVGLIFLGTGLAQENQIEKAKIFQEDYPLITESDLYCSIYLLDGALPGIKIIGAERQEEKVLLNDGDKFYIDKGKVDGLEIGQVFLVIGVGPKIMDYGNLTSRTGRARIIGLEENRGTVRIDKTCGQVLLGNDLIPFEEKEGMLGKDEGYAQELDENQGTMGSLIFIDTELHIAGTGQWAIIDMGSDRGVHIGQQMTIFKRVKIGVPREAIGSLVVIDVQKRTSTVKLLSCRDAVEVGFQVQTR